MLVKRSRLAAAVTAAALLAACTGNGDEVASDEPLFNSSEETASPTPPASEPDAGSSPSASGAMSASASDDATAAPDDFTVPDDITPEYVERVLNELSRLGAEVTDRVLELPVDPDARELPPEIEEDLAAIRAGFGLDVARRSQLDLLRDQEEREELLPTEESGQVRFTVERILATVPCVGAVVTRDFSETDASIDTEISPYAVIFLQRFADANTTSWKTTDLVFSESAPGSDDETALRNVTMEQITSQVGEVCA